MWFTDEMSRIYEEGIRPALVNTGLQPFLVSEPYHDGRIDDLIIGEIRRSGFLIADFTGHRPNVYFEAGFAMGLGVYVVRTCRESDIKALHFDQRQYRCTPWETADGLRKQLEEHIRAIRGKIQ